MINDVDFWWFHRFFSPITDFKNSRRVLGQEGDSWTQLRAPVSCFRILKSTKRGCHNSSNRWGHYSSGYGRSGQWCWLIGGFRYEIWPMIPLSKCLIFRGWNVETNNQMILRTLTSTTPLLRSNPHRPVAYLCPYQNLPGSWLAKMEPDFATFFELSAHIYPSLGHILASTLSLVNRHFAGSHFSPVFIFCRLLLLLSFP